MFHTLGLGVFYSKLYKSPDFTESDVKCIQDMFSLIYKTESIWLICLLVLSKY